MGEDFIKTEAKIYLDGKEVTNFFPGEVKVIAADEAQSGECLKLYDSFSGTITLSRKQSKRLIKGLLRAEKRAIRKYRWEKFKQIWSSNKEG